MNVQDFGDANSIPSGKETLEFVFFFCSLLNLNQRVLADAGTRAGAGAGGVVLFDK